MKEKIVVLEQAHDLFTQYGCKRVSMDDVANSLGISKKSIYVHFKNKSELVEQSVAYLLERTRSEMSSFFHTAEEPKDPFNRIVQIYRVGLKELRNLSPTFLFGLKKYYPEAYKLFENFRREVVWEYVYTLLKKAKEDQLIREGINLKLMCELFLLRIDEVILPHGEFFENYTTEELLDHLIIVPLQGIRK